MSIAIKNEKEVSPADILAEAKVIWKKLRALVKGGKQPELQDISKDHPEFCMSYPLVIKYMLVDEFSVKALDKYLRYIKNNPWTTQEGYLDAQAEYVVLLYKARHLHYSEKDVVNLKTNTRAMLQKEHDDFVAAAEKSSKQVSLREKVLKEDAKRDLYDLYHIKHSKAIDIPIRIKTDIQLGMAPLPYDEGVDDPANYRPSYSFMTATDLVD